MVLNGSFSPPLPILLPFLQVLLNLANVQSTHGGISPRKRRPSLLRVLPAFNDDPVGGGNRVLLNNAVVDGSTSQNAHIATWIAIWR